MTSKPRTQADRSAATRELLVRTARPMFAAHGYGAVGTEAIVRAAGVTRGALYHHFADKLDLFAAVVETVEADTTARIDDAVSSAGVEDPVELMRIGADAWLDASAEPEVQRIVVLEAPAALGWERWHEIGLKYGLGLVQSLLEYGMGVGRIPQQPVAPLAHVLLGALDEAALYIARADDRATARREVGAVVRRLVESLAT